MTALSGISDLPLFKSKSLDSADFESLLELLPDAFFIIEKNGRILFANSKTVELSAYTRQELRELDISSIFPSLKINKLFNSETQNLEGIALVTRRSKEIITNLELTALEGNSALTAISIKRSSVIESEKERGKRSTNRWEAIHILSLAAQQKDLSSTYRQILQAGTLLIGAKHLAIYGKENNSKLELLAVQGSKINFPAKISLEEIAHLREPKLWERGNRIKNSLHQLAHDHQLTFLASSPLEMTKPNHGLIIAADEEIAPPNDIHTLLQILAASASTAEINLLLFEQMQLQMDALSKNNALSHKLEESVQDGILYLDKELNVQGINPSAESMLGYSAEETIGRSVNNILISSHPLLNSLVRAQSGKQNEDVGDIKLHRRDGSDLLANLRIEIILENDDVSRIVVFITDLSENEALHIQSQQLQQRAWLGEVTAIFAHEVRNPINNISTGLQLMQINFDENDPLQEQISALQEDCDRLEHRMKSVLSFSRAMDHNPELIDLGVFCQIQLDRWRAKMTRNNIEPHLTLDKEASMIMGDRQSLDQVFTNLISNSIQAFDDQENGVIAVKLKNALDDAGNKIVILHFSDNGPGIPKDLAKRVFDPFFTTKASEGTGLGLAITKRIIQAHRGEIDLESFPGGTMFKIKLPGSNQVEGMEKE